MQGNGSAVQSAEEQQLETTHNMTLDLRADGCASAHILAQFYMCHPRVELASHALSSRSSLTCGRPLRMATAHDCDCADSMLASSRAI
eukprot:8086-Heterococcus_DN1.PRE.3